MEAMPRKSSAMVVCRQHFVICNSTTPQVISLSCLWKKKNVKIPAFFISSCKKHGDANKLISNLSLYARNNCRNLLINFLSDSNPVFKYGFFRTNSASASSIPSLVVNLQKSGLHPKIAGILIPAFFLQLLLGVMILTTLSAAVTQVPSWALSEENLLFLEAWRTIDRAYIDKTFNGQSWFRYRENALRTEAMETREETYTAIKKMVATLDDPFTRFLEPRKFKTLRSGTRNAVTGVGLSIGKDKSSGLVVVSAATGGPANKAGISPGDLILAIDGTDMKGMQVYDAAELLKGPEGSEVEIFLQHGSELKRLSLTRERVLLNPVKSRICKSLSTPGNDDGSLIGYIKLTSFNQNASGAVREAIETLRGRNVKAFVLDLRDNSGGLFPEGIEIAKIWLEKGVIVYICDSRGVTGVYDTDGSNAAAPSEPLAVLVNKGTASASEILAGALKDNKRAVVFGEPTYGKGKIQSVFELSDGSGLVVTVARYETPAHTDIDKVGVAPDHPLPASFPKDEDGFCVCIEDSSSSCYLNQLSTLFSLKI